MRRYYQILGVPTDATQDQIRAAWLFSLKAFHPDKFSGSSPEQQRTAHERTKAINEAYSVLSDPIKRANYDQQYARQSGAQPPRSAPSPPPQTPPSPPSPSVVLPLSSGYALYYTLPPTLQQRLRHRCRGKVSPQFKTRIGGVITAYLLLAIIISIAVAYFSSAGTERWDSDTTSGAMLTIFIGFAATAYSLFRIVRWHSSPLKCYLIITPLYVIETRFDELWYWPLWHVKGLSGTNRYYNSIYYGTDTLFTFEGDKRTYRLRQSSAYTALVEALRAFSQKALSAEKQDDRRYFVEENDFAAVKRVERPKRYRWKLATGTSAAAATASLLFAAAIFTINSTAPKPKPVHLGASSSAYRSPVPSSSSTFDPSTALPTKQDEPPYNPALEPANGYVFKNNLRPGGHGTLTITNGTTNGAIVKLVSTRLNRSIFTVFVAPNSNYTIKNIPNETYRLAYATGRRFNPLTDTFDHLYGISVFDEFLTYDTQTVEETDGVATYYHMFEVTLQPVVGGKARTSSLGAESFEQF